MNYRDFMLAVDKRMSEMSESEKNNWIYDVVRRTRESQRDKILVSLNKQRHTKKRSMNKDEVNGWCEKIEDEILCFKSSEYEEHNDNGWDSDYITGYSDPNNIEKNILERELLKQNQKNYSFELNVG